MMQAFLNESFLLHSDTARELYHECAARLPIIDYHCHIDPQAIAEDHVFCRYGGGLARRRPL